MAELHPTNKRDAAGLPPFYVRDGNDGVRIERLRDHRRYRVCPVQVVSCGMKTGAEAPVVLSRQFLEDLV